MAEKTNYAISRSRIMEFCGHIVDIFEAFADNTGMKFENPEVEMELDEDMASGEYKSREEAREANGYALIYGDDYDTITSEIEPIFYQADDLDGDGSGWVPEINEKRLHEIAEAAFEAFNEIVRKNGYAVTEDKRQMLIDEIKQAFVAWEFFGE